MKRVLYLNFDLSDGCKDPYERLCYQYLLSLGRHKKQVIKLLLRDSGLLNNFTPSQSIDTVLHKQSNIKKTDNQCFNMNAENTSRESKEISLPESKAPNRLKPLHSISLKEQTSLTNTEAPLSILTAEQIQVLQEKGIEYQSLSKSQLVVLADALSEGMPAKVAFMQAQFSQ